MGLRCVMWTCFAGWPVMGVVMFGRVYGWVVGIVGRIVGRESEPEFVAESVQEVIARLMNADDYKKVDVPVGVCFMGEIDLREAIDSLEKSGGRLLCSMSEGDVVIRRGVRAKDNFDIGVADADADVGESD